MREAVFYFVDEIESTFVLNDLIRVAAQYKKVYLFSIDKLQGKELLPPNVIVFEEFIEWKHFRPFQVVIKNAFSILGIIISESFALGRLLPFRASIAILASNIFKANEIRRVAKANSIEEVMGRSPFYSFWFYDCIYLAWLKKVKVAPYAVTRAHSGDLYEDHVSIKGKLLFRNFQMHFLDAVLPVSHMGTQYLREKYKKQEQKIITIYLGSSDPVAINPYQSNNYTIVSCASFRHHKRIHKIAEALLQLDIGLTWHHFGDENLDKEDPRIEEYKQRKEELMFKPNIEFIAHGNTSNEKLFDFYKNNPVNLFISLSAAEGIPVSMMEAISFGIPLLSTDVGGCKEIANKHTGILIPLETKIDEIAQILTDFWGSSKNSTVFREGVRQFWEQHFNAENNYARFFQILETETLQVA